MGDAGEQRVLKVNKPGIYSKILGQSPVVGDKAELQDLGRRMGCGRAHSPHGCHSRDWVTKDPPQG